MVAVGREVVGVNSTCEQHTVDIYNCKQRTVVFTFVYMQHTGVNNYYLVSASTWWPLGSFFLKAG